MAKFLRLKLRKFQRRMRRNAVPFAACSALLIAGLVSYAIHMNSQRPTVNPATYNSLLNLIGRIESNDNYNAHYGHADNTEINFTNMSIAQVMRWQADFLSKGGASSAVGRYQIINTTLAGLVKQLGINPSQKFDPATQDRLAIALLERRGSVDYAAQELTPAQFAANLAREWAALPSVTGPNPAASYYAGDGLNASRTSVDEVLKAIKPISVE